jgi:hypothetical protein
MSNSKFDVVLIDTADPPHVDDANILLRRIEFMWRALSAARDPSKDTTWIRCAWIDKQYFVAATTWAKGGGQLIITGSKAKRDAAYEGEDLKSVFASCVARLEFVAGTA